MHRTKKAFHFWTNRFFSKIRLRGVTFFSTLDHSNVTQGERHYSNANARAGAVVFFNREDGELERKCMRASSLRFSHQPLRPVARLDDSLYRRLLRVHPRIPRAPTSPVNFIPTLKPRETRSGSLRLNIVPLLCSTNYKHRHAGHRN